MVKASFFEKVYEVVRKVPKGKVVSYGDIANYIGGSARMVGWAMNAAYQQHPPIPAHRVVNRNGLLTGKFHFDTPDLMEQLLKNEGIEIKKNQVVDFKRLRWEIKIEC